MVIDILLRMAIHFWNKIFNLHILLSTSSVAVQTYRPSLWHSVARSMNLPVPLACSDEVSFNGHTFCHKDFELFVARPSVRDANSVPPEKEKEGEPEHFQSPTLSIHPFVT